MKLEKHDLNNRYAYWWLRSMHILLDYSVCTTVNYYGYVNPSHCFQRFTKFPACIAV